MHDLLCKVFYFYVSPKVRLLFLHQNVWLFITAPEAIFMLGGFLWHNLTIFFI